MIKTKSYKLSENINTYKLSNSSKRRAEKDLVQAREIILSITEKLQSAQQGNNYNFFCLFIHVCFYQKN